MGYTSIGLRKSRTLNTLSPIENWCFIALKYFEAIGHKFSFGLNVFNILDIRNSIDIWPMTGKADEPGAYYSNYVGLPGTDPNGVGVYADKSSAYYDRPWRLSQPREIIFFVRFDFD